MFLYIILILIPITMYYLNINPFSKYFSNTSEVEINSNISYLESSINELKSLNQYIDNGVPS